MAQFHDNFKYIRGCLSNVMEKRFSLQILANLFGVQKLTVYGWVSQEKTPINLSAESIVRTVNKILEWNLTVDQILNSDISKLYNINSKREKRLEDISRSYASNIIDFNTISNRLQMLRTKKGWSLKYVEQKVSEMFPNNREYHISHTHVADIEKMKVKNYHINKIKALATVYGVTLEYVLFGKTKTDTISIDRSIGMISIPLDNKISKMNDEQIIDFIKRLYEMLINMIPEESFLS